ncbi:MAG TPA: thiazole synthase [Dehalococcoidia bacterium]|jgi:thiazole synthase|nr:thiazole synthase [Dehalococcoidia bacterium]|tara:strand:+ start:44 stop:808 length:765 start_codon:yes stop_codon:yes gene_type:complete
MDDFLIIDNKKFQSRLLTGTGRHKNINQLIRSIENSETEIITVAIRRLNLDAKKEENILEIIKSKKLTILPNTAGCPTSKEAIFTAELARELTETDWIKLEVIPDSKYLLPDPIGTLEAAKELVKKGFKVLPYISADPVLALELEKIGCVTVMPLGSPIGSGQGIHTMESIKIIIEQSKVPVIVDAGIGVPSDAALVMESGADAVLINTAIAQAENPGIMASAFKLGVESGRQAFLAGRIPKKNIAVASSPSKE